MGLLESILNAMIGGAQSQSSRLNEQKRKIREAARQDPSKREEAEEILQKIEDRKSEISDYQESLKTQRMRLQEKEHERKNS